MQYSSRKDLIIAKWMDKATVVLRPSAEPPPLVCVSSPAVFLLRSVPPPLDWLSSGLSRTLPASEPAGAGPSSAHCLLHAENTKFKHIHMISQS